MFLRLGTLQVLFLQRDDENKYHYVFENEPCLENVFLSLIRLFYANNLQKRRNNFQRWHHNQYCSNHLELDDGLNKKSFEQNMGLILLHKTRRNNEIINRNYQL